MKLQDDDASALADDGVGSHGGVTPGLADRIVVWWFSDTDAYTWESCDSYGADSLGPLHLETRQFIEDQLEVFYGEFSEYFNLAEFPDVQEQLRPSEETVFLNAAGAPIDADFTSIENYDCFSGLCGVIRHRLDQPSLEQIKLAVELFNWTIDFGLSLCDTNARAIIRVGSAEEVAPFLLERILDRLANDAKQRAASQTPPSVVERRFLPLAPLLEFLGETIESANWVQNQLALRVFFWILEMYRAELEEESG
jgi:hypothetical protein